MKKNETKLAVEVETRLHCQRHRLKYRLSSVKSDFAMNNQFFLLLNDTEQANLSIKKSSTTD